jgi:DNA-directed RNA polymerase specialized sigma24 family protein
MCGTAETHEQEAAMSERTTGIAGPLARGGRMDDLTEAFVAHCNLLFTVAYEMLGSAADAEDVLQETWLRWVGVGLDTVRDQRAYLVRITTRQALADASNGKSP